MGVIRALKDSDQKRKRRSSMCRVAPGVRSYPSRLCRAGSGFRFSIWNSLVLDPVIIGRLQLGAARCCAYRGHRPVAGRRTEFRRSTAASRWRHLGGGRLGIGLSRPARRVPPRPKRLTENELSDFNWLCDDGCGEAIIETQYVDRNHSTEI